MNLYRPGTHRIEGPFMWRMAWVIVTLVLLPLVTVLVFLFYGILAILQTALTLSWYVVRLIKENWE